MSFVSVIATNSYITVVSDGKVTGRDGETLETDYQKSRKISDKQFIAVTGDRDMADQIFGIATYKEEPYNLLNASIDLRKKLINAMRNQPRVVLVVIGGVNEWGKIVYYYFTSKPEQQMIRGLPGDKHEKGFLSSDKVNPNKIEEKFDEFIDSVGIKTPHESLEVQRKLNDFVAGIDETVNENKFELIIEK
ncbi:hypothetical protein [Sporosarcina cyprini]|uniref:hypothetical protein n=1 Tax=Sporosarcina cyprini TaxID=2910523 RepID=UPI001EE018F0|nr:hypothetical protein [Sporosarcina cyprini]MCG3089142.1 hypothetical protein [Sporosarcina cyprini]